MKRNIGFIYESSYFKIDLIFFLEINMELKIEKALKKDQTRYFAFRCGRI